MKCCTSGNKAQTIIVVCMNLSGQTIPSYVIIYNAKAMNPEWMKCGLTGAKYTRSKNGWVDAELFEYWFKDYF